MLEAHVDEKPRNKNTEKANDKIEIKIIKKKTKPKKIYLKQDLARRYLKISDFTNTA